MKKILGEFNNQERDGRLDKIVEALKGGIYVNCSRTTRTGSTCQHEPS